MEVEGEEGEGEGLMSPFFIDPSDLPWFVKILPEAEELFGAHVFPHLISGPGETPHRARIRHSMIQQVCKWMFNTVWKKTTYIHYSMVRPQQALRLCSHAHVTSLVLDIDVLVEEWSTAATHFKNLKEVSQFLHISPS